AALLLLLVAWRWIARRRLSRRLLEVAARLEPKAQGSGRHRGGVEAALERLASSIDDTLLRASDAGIAADRLAAAVRHLPEGLVICDERGEIVHRSLTGSSDAHLERSILDLLNRAVDGETSEHEVEVAGPPPRLVHVAAAPLEGARIFGAFAVVTDLTRSRRLGDASRDVISNAGDLLAGPVRDLVPLLELLRDDPSLAPSLAPRLADQARRLRTLVDDVVALAQLDAAGEPVRQAIPAHLVVAEAVERTQPAADEGGIELDIAPAPRRLRVVGDRSQLTQALTKLVDNAVAYSGRGTTVSVRCRTEGPWVEFVVADEGIGVPGRDQQRIFERFFRVKGRARGGAGLGLSVARQIARSHGGDVELSSEEGRGSTFVLRVRAAPASAVDVARAG
ncbi:MAG: two-component system, OmpR family, sensor histidine kinase SenX3, partial [Actinomycetota bacterium]|nr:two-component system, OmpR family, sensor histidine kinase SenX3 [Actinomycetota bacterium]